jgi:hypothetical protein
MLMTTALFVALASAPTLRRRVVQDRPHGHQRSSARKRNEAQAAAGEGFIGTSDLRRRRWVWAAVLQDVERVFFETKIQREFVKRISLESDRKIARALHRKNIRSSVAKDNYFLFILFFRNTELMNQLNPINENIIINNRA